MKQLIHIKVGSVVLEGILNVPAQSKSIVIFAHGTGSSRHSPRNNFVANVLNKDSTSTLLFDLLTSEEDATYKNRFNIPILTERLKSVTCWLLDEELYKKFDIGYFGASTGAAAALEAANDPSCKVSAIVSRGGRVDLAKHVLGFVRAPTLLIVGEKDDTVLELNQEAYELIKAEKKLSVIDGATHLFEEAGALEKVAELAASWFKKYLS